MLVKVSSPQIRKASPRPSESKSNIQPHNDLNYIFKLYFIIIYNYTLKLYSKQSEKDGRKEEGRKESGAIKGKALNLVIEDVHQIPASLLSTTFLSPLPFHFLHLHTHVYSPIILSVTCARSCRRQSEGRWETRVMCSCFHRIYLLAVETGSNEAHRNDHMITKMTDDLREKHGVLKNQ